MLGTRAGVVVGRCRVLEHAHRRRRGNWNGRSRGRAPGCRRRSGHGWRWLDRSSIRSCGDASCITGQTYCRMLSGPGGNTGSNGPSTVVNYDCPPLNSGCPAHDCSCVTVHQGYQDCSSCRDDGGGGGRQLRQGVKRPRERYEGSATSVLTPARESPTAATAPFVPGYTATAPEWPGTSATSRAAPCSW